MNHETHELHESGSGIAERCCEGSRGIQSTVIAHRKFVRRVATLGERGIHAASASLGLVALKRDKSHAPFAFQCRGATPDSALPEIHAPLRYAGPWARTVRGINPTATDGPSRREALLFHPTPFSCVSYLSWFLS